MWNCSLNEQFSGILITFFITGLYFFSARLPAVFTVLRQPQRGPLSSSQLSDMVICALIVYLRKCREIKVYKVILTFSNVLGSLGRSVNSTLTLEYSEKSLSLLRAVRKCPGFQMDQNLQGLFRRAWREHCSL